VAVNLPLVTDKLAARAVFSYEERSGWIDKPNRDDANDAEPTNVRLKVNAQPIEQLSIGLSGWLSRSDFGAPSAGPSHIQTPVSVDEPISTDFDAYSLKLGYDFGRFSLSSMTGYLDFVNHGYLGQGANSLETRLDASTFAQEVNLTSNHGGSWRWSLGGMYRDSEDQLFQRLSNISGPVDQTYNSKSFAVAGELTRLFLDGKLDLTAGMRYFEDELTEREDARLFGFTPSGVFAREKFDDLSPRANVAWHPHHQMTVYASYAEGFRSGSAQNPPIVAAFPDVPPLEPDNLKNYEVGGKGSLWGGRLNFEAAAFYTDWRSVQQVLGVLVNNIPRTLRVNSGSASGVGFEIAATAAPVDGLTLGTNFSWNDLSVDRNVISFPPGSPPQGTVLFEKGNRLNYSPEYTAGASASYSFPLGGNGYAAELAASINHTTAQQTREISGGMLQVFAGDPMTIGRTSFSIDFPRRWTATLFVDNVTNEHGALTRNSAFILDSRIRPRTSGVQVEYYFE
jgi:iron complex outermembrane recepter protein